MNTDGGRDNAMVVTVVTLQRLRADVLDGSGVAAASSP